ncbi:MAG: hypothetical protein M3N47_10995 [Chloroflexota bacterium]|nr:hypothetical protein [Chloroflexota bacterium]
MSASRVRLSAIVLICLTGVSSTTVRLVGYGATQHTDAVAAYLRPATTSTARRSPRATS